MDSNKNQEQSLSQIIVVAVLVSLLAFAALILIGRSLLSRFTFQNKILDGKTRAEKQLVENKTAVEALKNQYSDLGDKRKLIANALPKSIDFPELTVMLENIARVSNVKLQSVADAAATTTEPTDGVTSSDNPQPFAFTITVETSYENLKLLLKNLESSARPMRVTAITVGNNSTGLNVQLSITTYYQVSDPLKIERKEVE